MTLARWAKWSVGPAALIAVYLMLWRCDREPVARVSDAQMLAWFAHSNTAYLSVRPTETGCAVRTLGSDAAHVYALVGCAGGGSAQGVEAVALDVDPDGTITGFRQPAIGRGYGRSIKQIFPGSIADKILGRAYSADVLDRATAATPSARP